MTNSVPITFFDMVFQTFFSCNFANSQFISSKSWCWKLFYWIGETLNLYLLSLGAENYFIGLEMLSFSLTGLLSAPIYGRITDITHSTKLTVTVSNLFEIGGEKVDSLIICSSLFERCCSMLCACHTTPTKKLFCLHVFHQAGPPQRVVGLGT